MNAAGVIELFSQCDSGGKGWLNIDDLQQVSPDLSPTELKFIFDQLDTDHDGKITKDNFVTSFETVITAGEQSGYKGMKRRASVCMPAPIARRILPKRKEEITYNSDQDETDHLPCQDEVLALYEQLQAAGLPTMLNQFEKVIGSFCKEIKDQKEQCEHLQHVYQTERQKHNSYMSQVECDLDRQLTVAEQLAREEERGRLEKEKEDMRDRLETEISELRNNIARMHKMEELFKGSTNKEKLNELKSRLQEITGENRNLRGKLTDNHIGMAMLKADMCQLRNEYEEKCTDLANEKENLIAYVQEQDNLTRQLQLLYDANKKLHDTNDSLRTALDVRTSVCRQFNLRTPSPLSSASGRHSPRAFTPIDRHQLQLLAMRGGTCDTDDDIDSGLARCSDAETPVHFPDSELSSEDVTDVEGRPHSDCGAHISCRTKSLAGVLLDTDSAPESTVSPRRRLSTQGSEPTGPPDRTFRVVMAGDASVGKTSIIMRLTKEKFVPNLPSTLGVDFHVKSLHVDGKNVAVQLWDTAGQERFRSMCKSYFRRADGALLVYDCTSERSFLNVRNWMETIQESVTKKIPVFLCSNKMDLRISATADGKRCIQKEDGEKLAKVYEAIFVETSAKEGTNIKRSLLDLVRELLACEDCEVKSTSLVLRQPIAETSRCSAPGPCSK